MLKKKNVFLLQCILCHTDAEPLTPLPKKNLLWALTELVAPPSSVPFSAFPWLCPASAGRPDSHEPPHWSHHPSQEGAVHWSCQPSAYTVSLSSRFTANISGCTSPRDQLNYSTFQQWRTWQPGTRDAMGECLKSSVQNYIYCKISTLLNMIHIYKYIHIPITMNWHAPVS